jgi:signal transduction histidine kinase
MTAPSQEHCAPAAGAPSRPKMPLLSPPPVGSLRRRVSVGYGFLVAGVVGMLGWASFESLIALEDELLTHVLGRVLTCAEQSDTAAEVPLACLGAIRTPAAVRGTGLVEIEDYDYVVAPSGRFAFETEPFEILDPFESTFAVALGGYLALTALLALAGGWMAARLALQPMTELERVVAETEPSQLGARLSERALPEEVEGLRRRLVLALENLERATERERLFSRYLSHELRTPLAVIRASLELIESEDLPDTTRARAMLRLQQASQEMESTTQTLLVLSRGSRTTPREVSTVRAIVDEELARFRFDAQRRGIELFSEGRDDPPRALAVSSLRLALRNLLSNALRHSGGTRVRVRVSGDALDVGDDGRGVAEEDFERLLRPFETEAADGFGLGLSLVHDLALRERWLVRLGTSPEGGLSVRLVLGPDDAAPSPARESSPDDAPE